MQAPAEGPAVVLEGDETIARVLVGCPTSFHKEYCFEEYARAVTSLSFKSYDVLLVENSPEDTFFKKIKAHKIPVIKGPYFEGARDRIVASRNLLREKALHGDYDYLLSLEQDVIPPKDIIELLIRHRKPVVSGVYFNRNVTPDGGVQLIPLVYALTDKERLTMRPLTFEELEEPALLPIVSCGLGCVLIHRDVLKEITFRYALNSFDDRWFCTDLYEKKIPLFCDSSVKCKHFILDRPYQWRDIKK